MKFRITITADYRTQVKRSAEETCRLLRERTQAVIVETMLLTPAGRLQDSTVEVEEFKGIAYVVTRASKPVASYSDERLAQFFVDHDEHPEQCEIHEAETC